MAKGHHKIPRRWYTKAQRDQDIAAAEQTQHLTRQALLMGVINGFDAKAQLDAMDEFIRKCDVRYRMECQRVRTEEAYNCKIVNEKAGLVPARVPAQLLEKFEELRKLRGYKS